MKYQISAIFQMAVTGTDARLYISGAVMYINGMYSYRQHINVAASFKGCDFFSGENICRV